MVAEKMLTMLAVAGCLWAAALDLRDRRIPNWLTGSLGCCGLTLHFFVSGWFGVGRAMAGLVLCGGCFLLPYLAGGLGAGDVKLIAAEGALLGSGHAGALLCTTAICGALFAVVVAFRGGVLRQTAGNLGVLARHHSLAGLQPHGTLNLKGANAIRIPYGLAIAGGVLLTVLPPLVEGSSR